MILTLRSGVRINTDQMVKYYPETSSETHDIVFTQAVAYTSSSPHGSSYIAGSRVKFPTAAERDAYLAKIDALVGAAVVE